MPAWRKAGLLLWCVGLMISIWLMFRLSVPYTSFDKHVDFLLTKQKVYHIDYWRYSFYAHVFTSIFVLPAGLTQFHQGFFSKGLHRKLGTIYLFTVLFISAPTGFLMGLHANGGLASKTSFVFLSSLWFFTTLMAFISVKKRKYEAHGEWMLYSYALTLSAIFFRLYVLLFGLMEVAARPQEVYVTVAWLSWVPNLLVAQGLIRMGFIRRLYRSSGM